jgi:FkbM family methyltransferase
MGEWLNQSIERTEMNGINLVSYNGQVKFLVPADYFQLQSLHMIYMEIWLGGEYDVFPVKDEQVVDVGGFLGDSAIYFLQKGAKFINIYEPGDTVEYISHNLALNEILSTQYKVHNAAVIGKSGTVSIESSWNCGQTSFERDSVRETGMGTKQTASLADIAVQDAILKFDTEGSEYPTFRFADWDTIRKFKAIMMEFHDRGHGMISDKLRVCGFELTKIVPNDNKTVEETHDTGSGMLYAKRID